MTDDAATAQAWAALTGANMGERRVRFVGDEYGVDVAGRRVRAAADSAPAPAHLAILILHYLAGTHAGLPVLAGDWLSLNDISMGARFREVYVERAVEPLRRAFGADPERLFEVLETVPGEKVERADAAIVVEVFAGVPMLVDVWKADEDFAAEAGVLFDRSVTQVFATEDILELAEQAAEALVARCRRAG